ncbi:MAG: hypothetical protein ACKOTB_10720 [Planctomycetia bacterium]
MKRFFGLCFAMFIALGAIALVGGDSGAVAGHGCHGRARGCHGGLLAHKKRCHGGLLHRKKRCHGEEAAPACESGCGEAAAECGSCAGGGCEGGSVISEGVPTEAAPAAPAAPAKT